MKRSRIWLMLALLLVIALLTSGCFQIRLFKLNVNSLAAGEMVTVRLDMYPVSMSATDTNESYQFLLIGYDNIDWEKSSKFDIGGVWGGPFGKGNNVALLNLLRTADNCNANGIDPADMTDFDSWRVVVSAQEFGPEGATAAQLGWRNQMKLYFKAPAGAADGQRGDVVVFTGAWEDYLPANGAPDAGETFCTGMIAFSVPYTD